MTLNLNDDDAALLRDILAQRRSVVDPKADLAARKAAAQAEYDAVVAERNARCNNDPVFLAGLEKARQEAEQSLRLEIERLREVAKADPSKADPRVDPVLRLRLGDIPPWTCMECRTGVFEVKHVRAGMTFCLPCWAKHRIHCDECGNSKTVLTAMCSDSKWRCEPCAKAYEANPPANPQGRFFFPASGGL